MCSEIVTFQQRKRPFRILFLFVKKRSEKKGKWREMEEERDEHYSNLFTVGLMIRHNDINKQS